jgi:surfeit locus 1 family protein
MLACMTSAARRPSLLLTGLVVIAMAILAGLGVWQLNRMQEKSAFLARLSAQGAAAPAALPAPERWAKLDLDAADLTRVRFGATWLPSVATVRVVMPEARPGERAPGGFGRYIIQAARLAGGEIVLVNRGFAPEAAVAGLPAAAGGAEITGFIRKPEPGNAFTPAPNLATRDFHLRDPRAIAAALGLSAAPFMVEAERAGAAALPVGVEVAALVARIPNNHLQYAFTWFGLMLTLGGVFAAYGASLRRRDEGSGGEGGAARASGL